jgi:RNA 3'-terminal phosphate cyclase-like protein
MTASSDDSSIDVIRTVFLKILAKFGVSDGLDLKIVKRGSPPLGGGEVQFTCPVLTSLSGVDLIDSGRIKKIRGLAAVTRISPQTSNRLVESCRALLNTFIPDIYIYADVYKGDEAGLSPGFGVSLIGESTTGALLHADCIGEAGSTPEAVGKRTAKALLAEIANGGFFSSSINWFVLVAMSLTVDNLNRVSFGAINEVDYSVMDAIKSFLGVSFQLKKLSSDGPFFISCVGSGYINFNQRMH